MTVSESKPPLEPRLTLREKSDALATGWQNILSTKFGEGGEFISQSLVTPCILIWTILIPTIVCAVFLPELKLNTDLNKLWTEQGGRSEWEIQYIEDHESNFTIGAQIASVASVDRDGGEAMTVEHFIEHERLAHYVSNEVTIDMYNRTWDIEDFCVKGTEGELSAALQIVKDIFGATPYDACLKISPLDCFQEGVYDYPLTLEESKRLETMAINLGVDLLGDYGVTLFSSKPSFRNMTTDELYHQVNTDPCTWVEFYAPPLNQIFGGFTRDENGHMKNINGLQTTFLVAPGPNMYSRHPGFSEKELDEALYAWEKEFVSHSRKEELQKFATIQTVSLYSRVALDQALEGASSFVKSLVIGVLLMAVYCVLAIAHNKYKPFSLGLLTLGCTGVILAALACAGAIGLCVKTDYVFSPDIVQVLPFVSLGIGVDDMFVIAYTFKRIVFEKIEQNRAGSHASTCGQIMKEVMAFAGPSVTLTSVANFLSFLVGSSVPVLAVSSFCQQCAIVVVFNYFMNIVVFSSVLSLMLQCNLFDTLTGIQLSVRRPQSSRVEPENNKTASDVEVLPDLPRNAVTPSLTPKVFVGLLVGTVLFSACIYGTTEVVLANDVKDLAPKDSVAGDYFAKAAEHFPTQQIQLITEYDVDLHTYDGQRALLDVIKRLQNTPYTGKYGTSQPIWIHSLRNYVNKSDLYNHGYYLNQEGLIPEEMFYDAYFSWRNEDLVSLEVQLTLSDAFNYKTVTRDGETRQELSYTIIVFFISFDLEKDVYAEIVNMINVMREIVDTAGISCFVTSDHIIRHEILTHLEEILLRNLIIAVVAVLVASFLLSFNIIVSFVVAAFVTVCAVELYGIMGLFGINLNPAPVVSLIMSVGLTVEFIAHLTYAYFNEGRKEERPLEGSMEKVAVPICHGAVSSILGIIMLAFSDFGFVVKYYFAIFLATIIIGLVNGMMLQPAIIRTAEVLMKKQHGYGENP